MTEEFKLINLIPKHQRFDNNRYKTISESIIWENIQTSNINRLSLVQQASEIIINNTIKQTPVKQLDGYDYIQSFRNKLQSSQTWSSSIQLQQTQIRNLNQNQIVLVLEQIAEKYLKNQNDFQFNQADDKLQQIAIELTNDQIDQFNKSNDKSSFIAQIIEKKIEYEGIMSIMSSSQQILQNNKISQEQQKMCFLTVYLFSSCLSFQQFNDLLEETFILDNNRLTKKNSINQMYVIPKQELSYIHSQEIFRKIILLIFQNGKMTTFEQVKNYYQQLKNQILTDLEVFKTILQAINWASNVISWQMLIYNLYNDMMLQNSLQLSQKSKNDKKIAIENDLLYQFKNQFRIQLQFFDVSIDEELTNYLKQPFFDNQQPMLPVAFQTFEEGILIYSRFQIPEINSCTNKIFCQTTILFGAKNSFKNYGNIGQIALINVEESTQKCIKFNLEIAKPYLDLFEQYLKKDQLKNPLSTLIIKTFCVIATFELYKRILNPNERQALITSYSATAKFPKQFS